MINFARYIQHFMTLGGFLLLGSCSTDLSDVDSRLDEQETNPTEETVNEEKAEFVLKSDLTCYSPFLVTDTTIHFQIANEDNIENIKISATHESLFKIIVDSVEITPEAIGHYLFDARCNVLIQSIEDGMCCSRKLITYNLPVLIITTPDKRPILSRETRTDSCEVFVVEDGNPKQLSNASIRGRGRSSWLQTKKPYDVKFDAKEALFGMSKSKHWILLANAYYDRTQLHNCVAFEMARYTDYSWVQNGEFVELILNGEHKGLYYFCEKIDVEKSKINIAKMSQSDISDEDITGGYFLEMTEYPDDVADGFKTDFFNTTGANFYRQIGWRYKEPEFDVIQKVQADWIKNYLNYVESLIYYDDSLKTGKYRDFFDVESAINWWLVEEAAVNNEASRTKNMYIYKERSDNHIKIGPPWDLDAWTFGLTGIRRFEVKETGYCYRQLFKDPYFINRLKSKWCAIYPIWRIKIPLFIENKYNHIHMAAERNEQMWSNWHSVNDFPGKNYKQIVDDMVKSFINQIDWMNEQINAM